MVCENGRAVVEGTLFFGGVDGGAGGQPLKPPIGGSPIPKNRHGTQVVGEILTTWQQEWASSRFPFAGFRDSKCFQLPRASTSRCVWCVVVAAFFSSFFFGGGSQTGLVSFRFPFKPIRKGYPQQRSIRTRIYMVMFLAN